MDKIVRDQLNSFLHKHVPEASLSALDDVVLDYVVEVLSNLHEGDDSSFDVEQLCEMIAAYVPEFTHVDSTVVCEWVFEVAQKVQSHYLESSTTPEHDINKKDLICTNTDHTVIDDPLPYDTLCKPEALAAHDSLVFDREQQSDKTEQTCQHSNHSHMHPESIDPDTLSLLMEIFPDCTKADIIETLQSHRGDVDLCIQTLLEGCNSSQCQQPVELEQKDLKPHSKKDAPCLEEDSHLKNSILSKYAFVDTKEDKRAHRPHLQAQDPKKLVRYRDNQVVNTKGERFTVVTKRDQEGDNMKKTYVNIKPLRKYRFH